MLPSTRNIIMVGLLTVSGGAAADIANEGPPRIAVGGFLGAATFDSELELGNARPSDQVPQSSFLMGARASYLILPDLAPTTSVNPALRIEAEGTVTLSSMEGNSGAGREDYFAPVFGWRAQLALDLFSDKRLRGSVLAGLGGETVITDSPFADSPDSDAGFVWGGTLAYGASDKIRVRGDFRQIVTAGRNDLTSLVHEFSVGIEFAFWQGPRSAPKPDPVPMPQLSMVKTLDPEPAGPTDTDGDGIPDTEDKCPSEAEIVNQIDDEDGCPEVDSDGDGLLGGADKCPEAKEDMDGFEDNDGCPELDNDKDTIPDLVDKCPLKPETSNGFEDEDGCPDKVPDPIKEYTGTIRGIRFRQGRADIRKSSETVLNRAVGLFKEYETLRIEIGGHTDNRGGRTRNVRLSRSRADAVKWYLVDKGIAADRLVTVGFGPDKPIAPNTSSKGRANNRRIEFRLITGQESKADTK